MSSKTAVLSAWKPWQTLLLAVLCGLAVGALTLLGQATLPGSWNHLANSGAVWLVPAFLFASLVRGIPLAITVSVILLLCEVAGYYTIAALVVTKVLPTFFFLGLWSAVALVGGSLAGVAGQWWNHERLSRRVLAVAFLGGIFVAEGCYLLLVIQEPPAGWGGIVIGLALALLLGHSMKERLLALAALPLLALLGLVVYLIILGFSLLPANVPGL